MVDRTETKPFGNKIDTRLQALIASPYSQKQLQLAGLINHRGQVLSYDDYQRSLSRRKRQQREREVITNEIVSRAFQIDRTHRLSRRRQFEVAARRAVDSNFDILKKHYRKQSNGRKKAREKSAPGYLTKEENDGEPRVRVTSAYNRKSKTTNDIQESTSERLHKIDIPPEERHATTQLGRDEIVVMQQHSTGENLIVYRGFLIKGESFSFKSQRRPTSGLSLAFYAKGFIDSVVNDCCEFKYGKRKHHTNEHSQFLIERVRKASPCEKCRKRYSQRARTSNVNNVPSDAIENEHSQRIHQNHFASTPQPSADNQEQISPEKQYSSSKAEHAPKKTKQHKKHLVSVTAIDENEKQVTTEQKSKKSSSKQQISTDRSASIDFSLLESTLADEVKPTAKSNDPSTVKESVENIQEKKSPSQDDRTVQQWINQTDAVSRDADTSSDSTSTTNAGNIFQMFMAHLQQQLQKLSHQAQSSGVKRHEKSVENFIYVLDGNVKISDKDKKKLRGFVNFGLTFDDINDKTCVEFITEIVHEQIILILSRNSMENLATNIRDASQLRFIYIIDDISGWSHDFEKIRGIYTNMARAYDQLEKDIISFTYDLTTILSVPSDDTNDSSFAYIQVLKDILLEIDETADLKKEMLDFCRQEYADNQIQLRFIDEFEHHFRLDEAIKWYTRQDTFLFKMLTRAFRTPDPDILFKLRFFIQHLHRQLKSNICTTSMIVYRTQYIPNDDFDKILKNQGGFLAFSQFLYVNKNKTTTKKMTKLPMVNSESKFVIFQMEIGTTIPRMNTEPSSEEILITAATVFRISNVEQVDDETSLVKLISNDDVLKAAQEVTKSVREAARGPFPLLRMAKLMKQIENIHHTEYFCLILMDDPIAINNETANLIVGGLFHTLCTFYYEQEQYDRALEQLHKSLKVYLRVLPEDDIKLTPTYNNMGSIYHKQGHNEQALQFHKKAYDIQVKSSNPDPDSVAAYAGNIAAVLVKQGKYDEAIPYLQRDLQIRQRLHPDGDDINLAVKYHNLAGAEFRVNKYTEALENYKKCLEIELKLHKPNHPTVAVTYYNMATALEGLGQLEEAIETIQKAIQRLLLTRDENDEDVQMHKEYEKRLQHKLWVKNLFGTV